MSAADGWGELWEPCMILIWDYLHGVQSEIFRIKAQSCSNCNTRVGVFFSHGKAYGRNRRKNRGERGRDTDFSSHQSEDYFWMPVFKIFVTFAAVIFENPPIFPGVCLLRTAEKLCWQHVGFDPLLSLPRLSSPHETLNKHALAHSEWLTSWVKGWCLYSFHFPFTKYWPNK